MREIKFRGLREDGKGFIYGNLLNNKSIGNVGEGLSHYVYAEVIPKSVGQFTGLKDKNGVDIYEGDVICLDKLDTHKWEMCYEGGGFIADPLIGNSFLNTKKLSNNNYLQFEVIGNIHESKGVTNG